MLHITIDIPWVMKEEKIAEVVDIIDQIYDGKEND